MLQICEATNENQVFERQIKPKDLLNIISKLKDAKATGPSGIQARHVKFLIK